MSSELLKYFPAPRFIDHIKLSSEELVTRNPQDGGLLRYTVVVEYSPDLICVDGDSLQKYLLEFGSETLIRAEEIAPLLVNDLFEFLDPKWMEIKVTEESSINKTVISSKSRSIDANGEFSPSSMR